MSERSPGPGSRDAGQRPEEPVPIGQRLFERPFLLLAACLVIMFTLYTGWGVVEMISLTHAPLP
jgi:hypothetical protein